MPPETEKPPIEVVNIDSSDNEEDDSVTTVQKSSNPKAALKTQSTSQLVSPADQKLEFRSFWKAGGFYVGPTSRKPLPVVDLEHARVHPKFLHSNATSHKWAFGAIAELLDNAVDEIHNGATFVKVDKVVIKKDNSPALVFQDDGGGMDPAALRKCMSLGYSSKKSNTTIGQYGNGFKTSTMRLGADVIVFSRVTCGSKASQSVGLLSYTFLRKTGQDDVIVPMVDFDISGHWAEPIIYSSQDDWSSNLKTILEWSPFTSKDELLQQFEDIGPHGTRILIYNLWLNDEGVYELSFDDDDEDIRLRDEASCGGQIKLSKKIAELQSHISYCIRYSLRAYASILYLRKFTNFSIIIRGKPVQQFFIADDLKFAKTVNYRPQLAVTSNEATVETTIGFIKEAPSLSVSGFNVYHKNRLIRPYWKVTGDGNSKGYGVVGVLEANFVEPAHDKQDFERSSLFIRLESRLKQILVEYWNKHCHLVGHQPRGSRSHYVPKEHGAKFQKQLPSNQHDVSLSADFQGGNLDQGNYLAEQPPIGFAAGSSVEVISENIGSMSVEQICDENLKLFMRIPTVEQRLKQQRTPIRLLSLDKCEEHDQKETKLRKTIEELEKELEQAKMKCAQLSAHLETRKKQKIMKQQTEKVL